MPGRRHPRKGWEESQASHIRSAFRGGMDGASLIPAPVRAEEWQSDARGGQSPQVLFYNDEFPSTGGAQTITLTYLPIVYSEHVYLCRGGGGGLYQRERTAWVRDPGSRTVTILTAMGARPGDAIVVEYAYYEQAPQHLETSNLYFPFDGTDIVDGGFIPNAGTWGNDGGAYAEGSTISPGLVAGSGTALSVPGSGGLYANATTVGGNPARQSAAMQYRMSTAIEFAQGGVLAGRTGRSQLAWIYAESGSVATQVLTVQIDWDTGALVVGAAAGAAPRPEVSVPLPGNPFRTFLVEASVTYDCWKWPGDTVGVADLILKLDGSGTSAAFPGVILGSTIYSEQETTGISAGLRVPDLDIIVDDTRFSWGIRHSWCGGT